MFNLEEAIKKIKRKYRIIGREEELKNILNAALSNKHVLLEGPVGIGKTTLAAAVANFLGRKIYRVDGDERYTEHKLTGWFDPPIVLSKGYSWKSFIPGPLTQAMIEGGVLFINELNRMPEGTQNVLLPAMDEKQIIIPKIGVIKAKEGFLVIATQNPQEYVGTSRLSEALRDRFVWIGLSYQSEEEEIDIVRKETGFEDRKVLTLAVKIMRKTRVHPEFRHGASIRGAVDFVELVKNRRNPDLNPELIVNLAVSAMYTKVALIGKTEKKLSEIIKEIVYSVLKELNWGSNPFTPKNENWGVNSNKLKQGQNIVENRKKQGVSFRERNTKIIEAVKEAIEKPGFIEKLSDDEVLNLVLKAEKEGYEWPVIKIYSLLSERALDAVTKRKIEDLIIKMVLEIAHRIAGKRIRRVRKERSECVPGLEEIDEDLTFENLIGKKVIDYQDIVCMQKIPRKVGVAVMLDTSNSMQREKIVLTAIAAATLLIKFKDDYCSVISFKDKPEVVKSVFEQEELTEVIRKILNLKTGGLTNIETALKKGLDELYEAKIREDISEKLGILITDGWVTRGEDPRHVAKKFDKLNVVQVGIGGGRKESVDLCKDLSKATNGNYTFLDNFNELPYKVAEII